MNGVHVHAPAAFAPPIPFDCRAGEAVSEIAARQHYRLPYFAVLNDEWLPRDQWDYELCEGDELGFVTLPAGGGGGKDILRSVLQIAIVAVSIYFAGPAGLGLTGASAAVAKLGAFAASGYLVNAIMPPQQASVSGAISPLGKASPTYTLAAQGNQARLDQVEPRPYGRHKVVPDFAAQPYSEYRDNDLYLYQLFSLGLGQQEVNEIGIEKTALWKEVGGLTDAFSDVEFEIVQPGQPVTLFPADVVTSAEASGQTLLGTNEDGADWIGPFPVCDVAKTVNKIAIDLVWEQGAFHVNDSGKLTEADTSVIAEAREIDDYGAPLSEWFSVLDETFVFAAREQQRVTRAADVAEARYEVRCKRSDAAATDDRTNDVVSWAALRGYIPSENTFDRVTTLAVVMRATNQLSNTTARRFYTIQTAMLPVYDADTETWSAPQATRSISAAAADILRNGTYGWGLADSKIDLATLASLEETWTARGETFDGIFDNKTDVWRALNDVLHVGRSYAIRVGSAVSFVRDEKRETARLMVTSRNIKRGSFSTDFLHYTPNTPDDVIVRYFDERVWNWRQVRATLPGSASANPANVTVFGITDRTRAWRYGMNQAATNKYRRIFPKATVELEGRFLKRGDLVPVSHPLVQWGRSADVAGFDVATRRLTLTQTAKLEEDETYYLSLKARDGRQWGPVVVTAGATDYQLIMDADDVTEADTAAGKSWDSFIVTIDDDADYEPTVAVWGKATSFMQDCLLIGAKPSGDDHMALELVVDDDRVYTADEGDPPAEDELDQLPETPPAPDVQGLSVQVTGTRFAPSLVASIFRSPGAESYIWELSYDHVRWRVLQAGDYTSWSGAVDATTVWLRVTAIGATRGEPAEWAQDLTATEAVAGALTAINVEASYQRAWINFGYPDEDGIEGVIAKLSTETGFGPETEGTVVYDGSPVSRISIDITAADTVYVRLAAYNRFGKVNLNWTNEIAITAVKVQGAELSPELQTSIAKIEVNETAISTEATTRQAADDALASQITTLGAVVDGNTAAISDEATARATADGALASDITTLQSTVGDQTASITTISESVDGVLARRVTKYDVNGYVTGSEEVNGGAGNSSFTVFADVFQVVDPTVDGGTPLKPFVVEDGAVKLLTAIADKIITERLAANWADVGTLVGGRFIDDATDTRFEINATNGWWTILR